MSENSIYDFELDENFNPKKRLVIYCPTDLIEKLDKTGKKNKLSKNKFGLEIIKNYFKEQPSM
ncbi:hypothetical protein FDE76_15060 [Clostridium botulinum]|uniref:CopG family transcriptional regulator n=2 Tax=Clostridium botulinum TaxID=1491 RepID=A0A0A0UZ93_CLOBO|nr:hypothetical protein [Clostridium botulinum]ACD14187.1 hypothetical protein CLL_0002 [Clostridium botulinum B str. Eklund 17B (NRP)]AIW54487.1 hypothetical protein [Clostridium botulinum]AIW54541.1 hypothetical protein [Clostridium botulinum]AIW54791.1 hypothetical protein [Clostridium botulinum]ALP68986.1 hypothetical protein [Clostridium botulinum]